MRHIVLVGLMGAGKTTVGRRLAARLGWPWHDSDAEITASTGLTVRELSARERDRSPSYGGRSVFGWEERRAPAKTGFTGDVDDE